jgi:hypothetical protein
MESPGGGNGSAEAETGALEKAVEQIQLNIQKIGDHLRKLIETIKGDWYLIWPPHKEKIVRGLRKLQAALDKIFKFVREVLAQYTPVISLIKTSFRWLGEFRKPVSNVSGQAGEFANKNLAFWDGATGLHYQEQVMKPQADAALDLANKGAFISEWLHGVAMSNVDFVTNLSFVIAEIVGEITTAALESIDVIDIPWALDRLANAVGLLVQKALETLLGIAQRIVQAGDNGRKIVSDLTDHSKFSDGTWPQAVRG